MTDQTPSTPSTAGLPAALYMAEHDGSERGYERQPPARQRRYERMAARLVAAGALTLLEVPPGHDPEPAVLTDTAVGDPVVKLAQAVNVLAISVGWLRGAGGELVLAGHFVGSQRDDPDREVAASWTMSKPAALGFLRQVVGASGVVSTALALEFATVAVQTGDEIVAAAPPGIIVARIPTPRNGQN